MKILIDQKGNKLYWKKGDLHTSFGKIEEKNIKSGIIKSHLGKEFICFDASFSDKIEKFKRGPAIMSLKDIGYIIAKTGINPKSKVLEAGTGSGILTAYISNICKVISYESNERFYRIAKKNLENFNVDLRFGDIHENTETYDCIILDLKDPWNIKAKLNSGGYLVAYLPNITQVIELVKKSKLYLDEVCEIIKRDWYVDHKVRPINNQIVHTGFLVFMRKF